MNKYNYVEFNRALIDKSENHHREVEEHFYKIDGVSIVKEGDNFSLDLMLGTVGIRPNGKFDLIRADNPSRVSSIRCKIIEVRDDNILFQVQSHRIIKVVDQLYNVRFIFSNSLFVKKRSGIEELRRRADFEQFVFPEPLLVLKPPLIVAEEKDLRCFNEKINKDKKQKQAIVNALKAVQRPAPYLISGPPGTGKTVVLIEAILQVYTRNEEAKVLVCSKTNSSVDDLTHLLLNAGVIAIEDIIRSAPTFVENPTASAQVKEVTKCWTCNNSDNGYGQYRIIATTAMHAYILTKFRHIRFDYVFIDEAHNLDDADASIPLNLMKQGGCCVLVGDSLYMLKASQMNEEEDGSEEEEEEDEFKISMFERLWNLPIYQRQLGLGNEHDPRYITNLTIAHRSNWRHQLGMSNELVDESLERLMASLKIKHQTIFCPVKGVCLDEAGSLCNREEVKYCVECVKRLYDEGLKPEQLAIITPYRRQRRELFNAFEGLELEICHVSTIDSFNGQEREIIIVSATLSDKEGGISREDAELNLHFLTYRFAMALSRAKWIVIVVGNPDVLKVHECWADYIEKADKFFDPDLSNTQPTDKISY